MTKDAKQRPLVVFQPSGRRGHISAGKTISEAARGLGVGIEGICGDQGTCGNCRVRIEEGDFQKYGIRSGVNNLSPLTEAEKSKLPRKQQQDGYRLACQARIRGDTVIFIPEESRVGRQIIRKTAREISIELKPAIRKYCVTLTPATLHDTLGDWERLQAELAKRFGLSDLAIDYTVLRKLQEIIRRGDWRVTVSVWLGKEVVTVEPGSVEKAYGLAVDIGTTTVAAYLCDLITGDVVATESMMNPQVAYGEDVMSRITYTATHRGGLAQLNRAIINCINQLAGSAAARAHTKRTAIRDMTVVGNTCMHHIFLNLAPRYLGRAPFAASRHHSADIKARDLGLKIAPGAYAHTLPIEAGFVGADNVGVLIAEEPYQQDEVVLVIDIGTNGELVLGNREKLTAASCATGPAFEGAEIKHGVRAAPGAIDKIRIDPSSKEVRFTVIGKEGWNAEVAGIGARGICGSGMVDAVAQLFLAGVIDHTGRFATSLSTSRLQTTADGPEFVIAGTGETTSGGEIVICQRDIRNMQLAKGALHAGARIMMRHLGVDKVDRIILAGAFGSYIDIESAAVIGLFPDCAPENIHAVGNAAGDGARLALLNTDKRKEADWIARQVRYLELATEPDFTKVFGQAMWFPRKKPVTKKRRSNTKI